jgi:hypothetical protein
MMIKCSTWKRRKRKTKPYGDQGKGINVEGGRQPYAGVGGGALAVLTGCP